MSNNSSTTLSKDELRFTDALGRSFSIGFEGKTETYVLPTMEQSSEMIHYIPKITRALCTLIISYNKLELAGHVNGTLSKIVLAIKNVNVTNTENAVKYLDEHVYGKTLSISNVAWNANLHCYEAEMRIESELISTLLQSF